MGHFSHFIVVPRFVSFEKSENKLKRGRGLYQVLKKLGKIVSIDHWVKAMSSIPKRSRLFTF